MADRLDCYLHQRASEAGLEAFALLEKATATWSPTSAPSCGAVHRLLQVHGAVGPCGNRTEKPRFLQLIATGSEHLKSRHTRRRQPCMSQRSASAPRPPQRGARQVAVLVRARRARRSMLRHRLLEQRAPRSMTDARVLKAWVRGVVHTTALRTHLGAKTTARQRGARWPAHDLYALARLSGRTRVCVLCPGTVRCHGSLRTVTDFDVRCLLSTSFDAPRLNCRFQRPVCSVAGS